MSSPFGSRTRTRVLLCLQLMESSYARQLARVLDAPVNGVQMALRSLERDGLIAGRAVGRTRLVQLDPRYFALRELQQYLRRLVEPEDELRARISSVRRRPRRSTKPL